MEKKSKQQENNPIPVNVPFQCDVMIGNGGEEEFILLV